MATHLSPIGRRCRTRSAVPAALYAGILQACDDAEALEIRELGEVALRAAGAAAVAGCTSALIDRISSRWLRGALSRWLRGALGVVIALLARQFACMAPAGSALQLIAKAVERAAWTSAVAPLYEGGAEWLDGWWYGETKRIFVSHPWDETDEYASLMLGLRELKYLFDHSVPPEKAIPHASKRIIDAVMSQRISQVSAVVVLASPGAENRPRVRSEIRSARRQGKRVIAARPRGSTELGKPVWADIQIPATAEAIAAAIWDAE